MTKTATKEAPAKETPSVAPGSITPAPAPRAQTLQRRPRGEVAQIDPQALIREAIAAGAGVETLERLTDLAMKIRAEQARAAWFEAMCEFQLRAPQIVKSQEANAGSFKFRYAPLDEIAEILFPILNDLNLSVSWTQRVEHQTVFVNCHIAHSLGHVESSGELGVPIPPPLQDGKGASAPMRVGIALSYGKRYTFQMRAGIAPANPEEALETAPVVRMPEPAAPAKAEGKPQEKPKAQPAGKPAAAPSGDLWVGRVKEVKEFANNNYTLWIVIGQDGMEFRTYDRDPASGGMIDFARGAGRSPMAIRFEKTAKGNLKMLSIEPAEPGSGDGPDE